ncbi:hypothetical protein ACQ86G_11985 [Roseateles chitinivorans]
MIKKIIVMFAFSAIATATYADAIGCMARCLGKKIASDDCAEICSD